MQLLVKDFAKELGCSESIIYRHIRNHKEELGDRIVKKAKQTWITEEGQDFIRGLMIQQPIVVSDTYFHRDLEQLEAENSMLKDKLIAMHEAMGAAQLKIDAGTRAQMALDAAESEKKALTDSLEAAKADLDTSRGQADKMALEAAQERERAEKAEAEARRLQEQLDRPLTFLERLTGRRKEE